MSNSYSQLNSSNQASEQKEKNNDIKEKESPNHPEDAKDKQMSDDDNSVEIRRHRPAGRRMIVDESD